MNVTRLSLQLSHFSSSPLFSMSSMYGGMKQNIKNSYFAKSFSTIFYSPTKNLKAQIESTTFKWMLNRAVHTEELVVTGQNFNSKSIAEYDSVLFFRDCRFIQCSGSNDGGAINSQMSLFVINCLFDGCQADVGGSIFTLGRTTIDSTSIGNSVGYVNGGAIFSNCPVFSLQYSSVFHSRSIGPIISSNGKTSNNFLNLTMSTSMDKMGCLGQSSDTSQIRNSLFSALFSGNCNAGIGLNCNKGVIISESMFFRLKATGTDEKIGWAITSNEVIDEVNIFGCYFDEITGDRGGPFGVINPSKTMKFHYCCFSDQVYSFLQSKENVSVISPVLSEKCRNGKYIVLSKINGFRDPSLTKLSLGKWLLDTLGQNRIHILIVVMFILGAFGGGLMSIFLYLLKNKRIKRKNKRKRNPPPEL